MFTNKRHTSTRSCRYQGPRARQERATADQQLLAVYSYPMTYTERSQTTPESRERDRDVCTCPPK